MYAVVNGLNHLMPVPLPPEWHDELFQVVAQAVPRREYPNVLWEGMTVETLTRLARRASRYLADKYKFDIAVGRPFARRRFRDRHAMLEEIEEFRAKQPCVFIVRIDRPKSDGSAHWSVLKSIADDKLRLLDSTGEHVLPTARLGVRGDRGTRLDPRSTLMLTFVAVNGEPID